METLLTRALLALAFTGAALWLTWTLKVIMIAIQGGLGQ